MQRAELLVQLQADIDRLARPFQHTEQTPGRPHHSRHGSLLEQLDDELTDSTPVSEGGTKFTPSSKPPVREEISVLIWEATDVAVRMVKLAGGKVRATVADNLSQLPSLVSSLEDENVVSAVVSEVSSLRQRIETQLTWQLRPRKLLGQCPQCRKKDSLVVFLDGYGPTQAKCQKCHTIWPRETLGILAGSLETPGDVTA